MARAYRGWLWIGLGSVLVAVALLHPLASDAARLRGNADTATGVIAGPDQPVAAARGEQFHPAIYGNLVAWQDTRNRLSVDIYGCDLSTGREFPICTAPGDQERPAVYRETVMWDDSRSADQTGSDIYGYDLSTGQESPICTAPGNQFHPTRDGDVVVWEDERNGPAADIYGYEVSTGSEFPVCTAAGW